MSTIKNETMNESNWHDIAQAFYELQTIVHITDKKGGFYNGKIAAVYGDFLMIEEKENGMTPIFFVQIKRMVPFTKEKKEKLKEVIHDKGNI